MNLLSNYCRKNDIKTSITVGVVGKKFLLETIMTNLLSFQDIRMWERAVLSIV